MELQSCDRAPRDALEAPLAVGVETLHCPTPLAWGRQQGRKCERGMGIVMVGWRRGSPGLPERQWQENLGSSSSYVNWVSSHWASED